MKGSIVALLVGLAFHASAQQPPPQLTITEQIAFQAIAEKARTLAAQQHDLDQLAESMRADVKKNHPGYRLTDSGQLEKDVPPAAKTPAPPK